MLASPFDPHWAADDGAAFFAWLADDLGDVDRTVTPFVVAAIHVPVVTSNYRPGPLTGTAFKRMERLLVHGGVDVVFQGHTHVYERTQRMRGGAAIISDDDDGHNKSGNDDDGVDIDDAGDAAEERRGRRSGDGSCPRPYIVKNSNNDNGGGGGGAPVYALVGTGGNLPGYSASFWKRPRPSWSHLRLQYVAGFAETLVWVSGGGGDGDDIPVLRYQVRWLQMID
jgi:hypothetical protein